MGAQSVIVSGSVNIGQRERIGNLDGGDMSGVASDQAATTLVATDRASSGKRRRAKSTGVPR